MLEPDIVITLRREPFYHPTWRLNGFGKPQMGFEMTSFGLQAADEIERLRKERDEARRIICHDESYNHKSGVTPREVAIDRGWDCFKEKP